ncbi:hypothetical protein PPTG_12472 [Phytophthora nicotianae INRA-310]|uniref:Uncharacterized protein n=3 Tax=Phytophthora nicotianae TaxID=4792 RepID=W2Q480_PHYN3|nr:hypothetical protein PPTG_12472 [Phytophthora nicotianae INRA-310]ETN07952.1 hypothetical protein PPTG_12472 [Phytophthora nicotianae INRA-310]
MKQPRREDALSVLTPLKRSRLMQMPREIHLLPKVTKLIAEFAMTTSEAAREAAATNQTQWLEELLTLPEFRDRMDETAQNLTEIAAIHGHSDVLVTVYKWWDRLSARQKRRVGCGRAHLLALENGNFDAFVGLQCLYNEWDMGEGLKSALENGQQTVVDTICKNLPHSKTLAWGSTLGRKVVIDLVLRQPKFDIKKRRKSVYRAMAMAAHNGHFVIVKFFNENYGNELFLEDEIKSDGIEEKEKDGNRNGEEESNDGDDDDDDDDSDEEVSDNDCPLASAVKAGHLDIAKYLYTNNGYKSSSLEKVLVGAASCGPLELVKLFYDDGKYDSLSPFGSAFEFAAGGGQVEIMTFFRSKEEFDAGSFDDAFVMAATFGKVDAIKYLYSVEEYKPSRSSVGSALEHAASEGYAEVVELLIVKEKLSPELVMKAFKAAAINMGPSFKVARDQAGVLECLFATGYITPSFIKSLFENAARRSSLDVVEFLYAKGAIPPGMANTAFGLAIRENGGDVVAFLAKTGAVPATMFEGDLGCAVVDSDVYTIASLYNNGCISRELLKRVSQGERHGHIRVERFFRQHLRRSCPQITVTNHNESSADEIDNDAYDFHQLKCLDTELLPQTIRSLPHVMKLVDLFCMSVDTAMLEAAATGEIEWLKILMPRFVGNIEDMVYKLTDLAATYGHTDVIRAVHTWWKSSGESGNISCARAKLIAADLGRLEAMKCLLELYRIDTLDPLKRALDHGHHDIVEVICKEMDPELSLPWAAQHRELEAIKQIYHHRRDADMWEFLQAVMAAISSGNFEIVKFLNETCGEDLYQRGTNHKDCCPLTRAIECGHVELVKYLYANGYKATSFEIAFSAAVSYGPLELVELFCGDERCSAASINQGFVVAAGAGQLANMKCLQLKQEFDDSMLAEAFKRAAGCGQTEVVEHLYSERDQISTSAFEEAAIVAGGGGHLSVLKLLDGKNPISDELAVKVFLSAAKDKGLRCSDIDDQVGVLEFLHAKGCIASDVIVKVFPEAAGSSSVDVMEFLYTTASIPSYVVDEAFENASYDNCVEVVEFLYKTGGVFAKTIEETFMVSARDEDMYFVECLYNCGCVSRELLEKASQSAETTSLFHLFLSRTRDNEALKKAFA